MTRNARIRQELAWLTQHDVVIDWNTHTPGDPRDRRWTVISRRMGGRTYTTGEVEAFIEGTLAALDKPAYPRG